MKCNSCGADIPDGSLFCTECGAKTEQIAETTPVPAEDVSNCATQTQTVVSQNITSAPVNNCAPVSEPKPSKATKVASTGAFFWLEVLYAIPFIGFIACIVFAAASENQNIKHHATAKIILVLVSLALSIISIIAIFTAIAKSGISLGDIDRIFNLYY